MKKISGDNNINNPLCPQSENPCEFLNEIIQLRAEVDSLTELVRTDALTGLHNFRFFKETLIRHFKIPPLLPYIIFYF